MSGADLDRALEAAVRSVVRLLDAVGDPQALTAGGEWTVRETAAHVVADVHLYAGMLAGRPSPLTTRDAFAPFNAGVFLGQPCTDLTALGRLLAEAAAGYRSLAAGVRVDEMRPWHFGRSLPAAMHTGLILNELLMHGTDMARAAGIAWADEDEVAALTWRVIGPPLTLTRFLPDLAGDLDATFALGLAGEAPSVFRISAGTISRDGGATPDCTVSGPGMALLRWFFQRDTVDAGALTVRGPRPELAHQLSAILRRI